ncbi:MAG: hypothetical protein AVO38_13560 [delta proteobacterium ML8_D]|nr:MAG: hypothetical protein AVO34_10060 [Firmicutes bacterium ML8_F2]OPL13252.1 MAG: hypothetical protein AVO38_13560 [delta proteobacterium ML8_D]
MIRKPEDLLINKINRSFGPRGLGIECQKTEDKKRYPRICLCQVRGFFWIERPKAKGGNTP